MRGKPKTSRQRVITTPWMGVGDSKNVPSWNVSADVWEENQKRSVGVRGSRKVRMRDERAKPGG